MGNVKILSSQFSINLKFKTSKVYFLKCLPHLLNKAEFLKKFMEGELFNGYKVRVIEDWQVLEICCTTQCI